MMRMKIMKIKLLLPILLVLALSGCDNPYRIASKLSDDLGESIKQGATTVHGLQQSNLISADEDRTVLTDMDSLNSLNGVYQGCVSAAHIAGDRPSAFMACADQLLASFRSSSTLSAIRVTNTGAQQKINGWIQGVQTIIDGARVGLSKVRGS